MVLNLYTIIKRERKKKKRKREKWNRKKERKAFFFSNKLMAFSCIYGRWYWFHKLNLDSIQTIILNLVEFIHCALELYVSFISNIDKQRAYGWNYVLFAHLSNHLFLFFFILFVLLYFFFFLLFIYSFILCMNYFILFTNTQKYSVHIYNFFYWYIYIYIYNI
jgi:hypothetical protein